MAVKLLGVAPSLAIDGAPKGYVDGTIRNLSGNTVLNNRDIALVDCTGGNVQITVGPTAGSWYFVKRTDATANTLTIIGSSGTIDGDANARLIGQDAAVELVGDGTNLQIFAINGTPAPNPPIRYFEQVQCFAQSITNGGALKTLTALSAYQLDSSVGSAWNTRASGDWVCPATGPYSFTIAAKYGAWVSGNFVRAGINNTTTAIYLAHIGYQSDQEGRTLLTVTGVWVTAGDILNFQVYQNSGSTQTLDTPYSYISIGKD